MKMYRTQIQCLLAQLLIGFVANSSSAATRPNAWQIADSSGATGSLHYTNTLTAAQKLAATNSGWRFTVVSRLVEGSGGTGPAQFMTYGHGDRRFNVGWDTNAAGQLTAQLYGVGGITLILTAAGQGTNDYHRHELVYNPSTANATYLFDGASMFTWAGLVPDANYNGQALFGAAATGGKGRMNYQQVQFSTNLNNPGLVSEYFAGFEGSPAIAPHPTNQGWSLTWSVPSTFLTNFPVSPDTANAPGVDAYRLAVLAEPALVGYYPVDGDTGSILTDRRFPSQNATNAGLASIGTGPGVVGTDSFNGGGGRADLGVVPEYQFSNGVGTVEAVLYQTNISAGNPCFFSCRSAGGTRYSLHGNGGGTNALYFWNGATVARFLTPVNLLNRRVHVAFVFTNGTVTAYCNGLSLGTTNLSLGVAGQPCQIGAATPANLDSWLGQIDELAVYTNAQSAQSLAVRPLLLDIFQPVVFPVSPAYTWTTLAGYAGVGSADGPGGLAQFGRASGVVIDSSGNTFVADTYNHTIRKITPAGVVSTIAGLAGISGTNNGTGSNARFSFPKGIALDGADNLYVADTGNDRIRKITPNGMSWEVSTIVTGISGGDALAIDSVSNFYVADPQGHTIRKINSAGVVTTLAGIVGTPGTNDGPGNSARFSSPQGLAIDSADNLDVADTGNDTIRKITSAGVVSTIAGKAGFSGNVDGDGLSQARFLSPLGIAVDNDGNLYVTVRDVIRKLTPNGTNWNASTLAGSENYGSADGTGTGARFLAPSGLTVDPAGNILVCDSGNSLIRRVTSAGVVSTVAGSGGVGGGDGTGDAARFYQPVGVAVDAAGSVFVADTENGTIRKITSAGVVSTIAGLAGNRGTTDGAGSQARFNEPWSVAVDPNGVVFVADAFNHTIRKITPAGVVSTIAGSAGMVGTNDGTGSNARFSDPTGVAAGDAGELYVADHGNHSIRKIVLSGSNWVVSTFAGSAGMSGTNDGTGSNARFSGPFGIAVDSAHNLYVADTFNSTIRMISPAGAVSTIAGLAGSIGNTDGPGGSARFQTPGSVAVDSAGNLYVADYYGSTVRKLTFFGASWVVSTIGGRYGTTGSADGAGGAARFNNPYGIGVDISGNVFVADSANNTIRKGVFTPFAPINQAAYVNPPMNGRITVTLQGAGGNGQWRFPWELGWHDSGYGASNLVAGNYPIEFRNLPGYLAIPLSGPVTLNNGAALSITNQYYPTLGAGDSNNAAGSLTVLLGVTPPAGAGWRFLGDNTPFLPHLFSTNLLPGTYLIEFAAVSGRVKPPSQAVQINTGQPTFLSVNYLLAATPPANVQLPFPVPANLVGDEITYPFGFNGQLQSDNGYGSGVAVSTNVVLTAAHLVFNDQTLSYVNRAHWFFRRDAGVNEPLPQEARGFYVLSGYAAQRTNDLASGSVPDQSTPPSRNMDVAALYFLLPVAGGGHGGYLPSDAVPNTWLTSTALKMLVGYPVDGSQFGDAGITANAGRMYQTDPQPFPLSLATDVVPGQQQEVYEAPWFLSYPGNSGGPLYVQLNGYYYPAAVYLGTRFSGSQPVSSLVRAIDSNVANLITLAASQGDSGTNNTGGGVITIIPSRGVSANDPGFVVCTIEPRAAFLAGAGCRLAGDPFYSTTSNYLRQVTSTNAFALEFKEIPGWNSPTNRTLTVQPGFRTDTIAFYTVTNPVLVTRAAGFGITGTTGTTYRIEQRSSLTSSNWSPLSTNTINSTGFNLVLPRPLTNPPTTFYRLQWLP